MKYRVIQYEDFSSDRPYISDSLNGYGIWCGLSRKEKEGFS
jgi:hypothetical protein